MPRCFSCPFFYGNPKKLQDLEHHTHSGCFFRQIEFAKEHLRTGALRRHLLYFFFICAILLQAIHLQMRKTNMIELQ
jgi:hypothetical protein